MAFLNGIAHHRRRATADGIVVNSLTDCAITTNSRARINAFVVNASLVLSAIRAEGTFWSTFVTIRITEEAL